MSEQPFGHGQLSYMQIPADDTKASADFYAKVFGWEIRGDGGDHVGFTAGGFIGAFVTGREISRRAGVIPYITVDGIDAARERIGANGGEALSEPYREGDLWVATFRDPAGNVVGVWTMGDR